MTLNRVPTLPGGTAGPPAPPGPSATLPGFLWNPLLDPQTQEAISASRSPSELLLVPAPMQPLRTQAEGTRVHSRMLLLFFRKNPHLVHHPGNCITSLLC